MEVGRLFSAGKRNLDKVITKSMSKDQRKGISPQGSDAETGSSTSHDFGIEAVAPKGNRSASRKVYLALSIVFFVLLGTFLLGLIAVAASPRHRNRFFDGIGGQSQVEKGVNNEDREEIDDVSLPSPQEPSNPSQPGTVEMDSDDPSPPLQSPTTTLAPSYHPTSSPSSRPTQAPSVSPTLQYIPANPIPQNPPRGYFNYDVDSPYGPNNWHKVDTSQHWLQEFGPDGFGAWDSHLDYDPTVNRCMEGGKNQSPKDLVEMTPCLATHEIRTECANQPLSHPDAFRKLILPHKLSLVAERRPCLDATKDGFGLGECREERPPMVDYPKYSSDGSDYSDMHHLDIKVPGEHRFDGVEPFDAELQLFHTHLSDGRLSSIGIPVRATESDFNAEFQEILDEFQIVYSRHALECAANARRLRGEPPLQAANSTERELVSHLRFNPYSNAFMTTIFFWRYDGSLTEPPCVPMSWWVMDAPMLISFEQLQQIKRLLFTHVDSNCHKTSVHTEEQSVARPVQPLNRDSTDDRQFPQHCKPGSFRSDLEIGRGEGKRCRLNVP